MMAGTNLDFDDVLLAVLGANALPDEEGHAAAEGRGRCRGFATALRGAWRAMGVTRYRTFREAEEALWCQPGDPLSLQIASSLFALVRRLRANAPPCGVQRYRTLEEAERARCLGGAQASDTPQLIERGASSS
jgi:hypothetical protein